MVVDPLQLAIDKLAAPDYQRDIYRWARDRLDIYLYSLQRIIGELKRDHTRVAVPSCHSSGKSAVCGVISCHHIDQHPIGEARLVSTAPSGDQVRGVLWTEINRMHERARDLGSPLPGRVNQTEWWIGSFQAGIGRKPSDYKPEQFAGFHARYPLIVLDEADGLPAELWSGVEALMTNRKAKMLCIGNPLDPNSAFAKAQEEPTDFVTLHIPYSKTPNFSGEINDIPEPYRSLLQDVLLDPGWVEARRREWGGQRAIDDPTYQPDHPFWYGRVLALYPPQAMHIIINANDLEACHLIEDPPGGGVRQLGVDIAGSERGDQTVLRERVGRHVLRKWALQSPDDDAITDFIVDTAKLAQSEVIVMDSTGMGHGYTGRIRKALGGKVVVVPINFQSAATEVNDDGSRRYANMRAQLWWHGRELSRDRAWITTYAEDRDNLEFELAAARYKPDVLAQSNIVQVEGKDDIRKRIGRSPDDADATLLAVHPTRRSGTAVLSGPGATVLPQGAAVAVPRR